MSKEIPPKSEAFPGVTKYTNEPLILPKHEKKNKMLFGRHVLVKNINKDRVWVFDLISGDSGIYPREKGIKVAVMLMNKYKKLRIIPVYYNKDGEFTDKTTEGK